MTSIVDRIAEASCGHCWRHVCRPDRTFPGQCESRICPECHREEYRRRWQHLNGWGEWQVWDSDACKRMRRAWGYDK